MISLPKDEREYIIYTLLVDNHISFNDISKWYVASLQRQIDRDLNIKAELATCLLMETSDQRAPRKTKWLKNELNILVHRTLAILDVVNCFNLETLKERYKYNEELGKSQGVFWTAWEKL